MVDKTELLSILFEDFLEGFGSGYEARRFDEDTAMEKKWITVKETVELFVVKEATVRYAINTNQVPSSREKRNGREVLVILEDDAVNRWARRSDELIDAFFADLVERFDEKFPRGDQTGLSAKQQFESKVYGKVGLPDGKPRSLSLQNIFENAIGGTIASAGVFAGVKFLEFLQKSLAAGDASPKPQQSDNAVISDEDLYYRKISNEYGKALD